MLECTGEWGLHVCICVSALLLIILEEKNHLGYLGQIPVLATEVGVASCAREAQQNQAARDIFLFLPFPASKENFSSQHQRDFFYFLFFWCQGSLQLSERLAPKPVKSS